MNALEKKLVSALLMRNVHALWIAEDEHPAMVEALQKYVDAGLLTCNIKDGISEYREVERAPARMK
jgi:hypothetical protein